MKYLVALIWVILIAGLGYFPKQGDFWLIIAFYVPLFGLYLATYQVIKKHHDILFFIFLSIFLRGILLFAFPNLSDDIYRFLWDGHLWIRGENPFMLTPNAWMEQAINPDPIFEQLYKNLNSPDYHSVYPPVCQLIFLSAVKIFPASIYWSSVFMKVFILGAEVSTLYVLMKFLPRLGIPLKRVLLYALNPLIIIELSGNLHFEAIMIFFLIAALWAFMRNRYFIFSFLMALSIGTKLLPLIFLPFFIKRLSFDTFIKCMMILGGVLLAIFLPFLDASFIEGFSTSLDLYFRKFEFNGSIYYLIRWFGFQWKGYNIIGTLGPTLSVATVVLILGLAYFENKTDLKHFFKVALIGFTYYLFFSTTIHPWYLSIPVLLSLFTYFRYPIFWSGLIFLTYINYSYHPYYENLWMVTIEYLSVFTLFIMEILKIPVFRIILLYYTRGLRYLRR